MSKKRDYVPSVFKIICFCKAHVTVRTKEQLKTQPCWECGRTIKVTMGMGPGNYRCSIIDHDNIEQPVRPIHVDQG